MDRPRMTEPAAQIVRPVKTPNQSRNLVRMSAFAGLALLLFGASVISAVHILEARVVARVERELAEELGSPAREVGRMVAGLEDQIAALERKLEQIARPGRQEQAELERTRAGLIAAWQELDRSAHARHEGLLAKLDGYASSLEERVRALLEAVDVLVAEAER